VYLALFLFFDFNLLFVLPLCAFCFCLSLFLLQFYLASLCFHLCFCHRFPRLSLCFFYFAQSLLLQVQKLVRLDASLTVQEAVFAVEALLRFPVPQIEEVGLAVPEKHRRPGRPFFLDKSASLASYKPLFKVLLLVLSALFHLAQEIGDQLDFKYESVLSEPKAVKHKGHIDARQSLDLSSLINPANPKKIFKNLKQIGSGGFADVCLAWDADNQRVVIKRIRLTNLNLKYVLDEVRKVLFLVGLLSLC
jgi:hypothetical protein